MNKHTTPRLPRTGMLENAPSRLVDSLEALAVPLTLEADEVLFEQGDEGDALYAVLSGTLGVSVNSPEGRKLALDVVLPGNLVGEIALFDPGARTATITAREKTELLYVTRADLVAAIEVNPVLGLDILATAAQRMRLLTDQLHQQAFLRLPERLARKILHLTGQKALEKDVLDISQEELADFSGASREAVSKTLAKWRADGVVDLKRQRIVILDRTVLAELGGEDII